MYVFKFQFLCTYDYFFNVLISQNVSSFLLLKPLVGLYYCSACNILYPDTHRSAVTLQLFCAMAPTTAFDSFQPDIQTMPLFPSVLPQARDKPVPPGCLCTNQNSASKCHSFRSIPRQKLVVGWFPPSLSALYQESDGTKMSEVTMRFLSIVSAAFIFRSFVLLLKFLNWFSEASQSSFGLGLYVGVFMKK